MLHFTIARSKVIISFEDEVQGNEHTLAICLEEGEGRNIRIHFHGLTQILVLLEHIWTLKYVGTVVSVGARARV